MLIKIIYAPIGLALVVIRLGLLIGLVFLRLILTYLQGAQSPITSSLTRLYLISCGVFIMAEGDTSKGFFSENFQTQKTTEAVLTMSKFDPYLIFLNDELHIILKRRNLRAIRVFLYIIIGGYIGGRKVVENAIFIL